MVGENDEIETAERHRTQQPPGPVRFVALRFPGCGQMTWYDRPEIFAGRQPLPPGVAETTYRSTGTYTRRDDGEFAEIYEAQHGEYMPPEDDPAVVAARTKHATAIYQAKLKHRCSGTGRDRFYTTTAEQCPICGEDYIQ